MRRFAALLSLLATGLLLMVQAAPAQTPEEPVKANFLYRFASFVTWPQTVFTDAQAPIELCVVGANSFARALESAVVGQHANGHPFEVQRLDMITAAARCNVVYVTGDRTSDVLRAVRGQPVLTVTDGTEGRGDTRGMIHFVIVDDRVRFHIDDARAAESNLFMSSRLLTLAVSVRRRRGAA